MLSTHHLKLLDATLKVSALQQIIPTDVPKHLICSKNVALRQTLWACPNSAGDIRTWREESERVRPLTQSGQYQYETIIPDRVNADIPTVLFPMDYVHEPLADLKYLALSPAPSLGLIYEVFKRGFETGQPNTMESKVLQPNPSAFSNHGELMLTQSGRYRSMNTHIPRTRHYDQDEYESLKEKLAAEDSFVLFTARVEDANVGAGLIVNGLPAITAVGGFIHVLERETLQNIDFAVGVRSVHVDQGKAKYVDQSPNNRGNLSKGVVKNVRFNYKETTGTVEIVMILRCADQKKLMKALKEGVYRIAGGTVWDATVTTKVKAEDVANTIWIYSNEKFDQRIDDYFANHPEIEVAPNSDNPSLRKPDILDCAISFNNLRENHHSYSIIPNGYVLLEEPKKRNNLRTKGYDHAFAEPLFCLIELSNDFDLNHVFWKRYHTDTLVYWQ
ncbi:type I-F CRISPR-associated protein Csy2 [Acinetobacter sp. YH12153]|uniref:type I-F CRISPR-associated protein Csy2 n=1 Tax=Acinetobacter sp. YH12153 TaxID=2601133 RepID=UPI0015D3B7C0|nr:type I-F CRISPR-associated protein Csy2 [Acinetobacter sp. YH12153]